MKYLLVILVGVAPLAALTVWNLLARESPDGVAASTENPPKLDGARQLAGAAQQSAASETVEIEKLAEAAASPYSQNALFAGGPGVQQMSNVWKAFRESRKLAGEFARKDGMNLPPELPVEPGLPDLARRLEGVKQRQARLVEIRAEFEQATITDHDAVAALIGRDLEVIEQEIAELTQSQAERSDMALAVESFRQRRYQDCVDALARAQGPEAVELRLRAEFRRDAEPLTEQARDVDIGQGRQDLKKLRAMQAGLAQLVRGKFKQAPAPQENELHAQCVADLEKLEGAVFVKELELAPPNDLSGWGRIGDEMSRRFPQPRVRTTGRDLFTAWLDQQLDAEKSSLLERSDMKEAVRGKDTLLKGYFDAQQGGTWFKHFKSQQDRVANLYDSVVAVELSVKPREPLPVTLCKEYRRQVRSLLKGERSQEDWSDFAAACESWQAQLEEYRTTFGQQADIAFEDEADFAGRVLENWDKIEGLMVK